MCGPVCTPTAIRTAPLRILAMEQAEPSAVAITT
jgi:hypothetical protein